MMALAPNEVKSDCDNYHVMPLLSHKGQPSLQPFIGGFVSLSKDIVTSDFIEFSLPNLSRGTQ